MCDVIWCHVMSCDVIWCHLMSFHLYKPWSEHLALVTTLWISLTMCQVLSSSQATLDRRQRNTVHSRCCTLTVSFCAMRAAANQAKWPSLWEFCTLFVSSLIWSWYSVQPIWPNLHWQIDTFSWACPKAAGVCLRLCAACGVSPQEVHMSKIPGVEAPKQSSSNHTIQ